MDGTNRIVLVELSRAVEQQRSSLCRNRVADSSLDGLKNKNQHTSRLVDWDRITFNGPQGLVYSILIGEGRT